MSERVVEAQTAAILPSYDSHGIIGAVVSNDKRRLGWHHEAEMNLEALIISPSVWPHEDPCMYAAETKRSHPYLFVHVLMLDVCNHLAQLRREFTVTPQDRRTKLDLFPTPCFLVMDPFIVLN